MTGQARGLSLLVWQEGGGVAVVQGEDGLVRLLSVAPGVDPDAPLPCLGTCTPGHMAAVAREILAALEPPPSPLSRTDPSP